jgi:AraC family transcriptional regulator
LVEALLQHLQHLLKNDQMHRVDSNPSHSFHIQKTINYIHQNIADGLSIEQLAKAAGLHPSWFRQLFKQVVGMTVHRYIMHHRLERARDLLVNTNMPLLQLSHETGFSSQSHFTDNFKKNYGATPSQYRKRL